MVVVRHYPGDEAPWDGWYVLVGHFGEETSLMSFRKAGEQLPVVTINAELGPCWFVWVDVADQGSAAA